jgi:hypothetical protein
MELGGLKRRGSLMRNGTRNSLLAAAAALMVGGPGAPRAEEAPARLAIYVNGVLEQCVAGVARLSDVPYREETSDRRTRWELKAVRGRAAGGCPDAIPRRLPLPANAAAVEGETRTFVSAGERTTWKTFIFGAGKTGAEPKASGKQGY